MHCHFPEKKSHFLITRLSVDDGHCSPGHRGDGLSKDIFEPAVNVSRVETFETGVEGRVAVPVLLLVLVVVARQGSETVHNFTDVRHEKKKLKMSKDDVLRSNLSNAKISYQVVSIGHFHALFGSFLHMKYIQTITPLSAYIRVS